MQRNYNLQFIYSTTKRIPAKLAVVRSQASPDILRCTICGDREYYHPAVAGSDLQSRFQLQRNSLLKSHRRAVDRIWEQGPSTGEYCKWNHSPFYCGPAQLTTEHCSSSFFSSCFWWPHCSTAAFCRSARKQKQSNDNIGPQYDLKTFFPCFCHTDHNVKIKIAFS